jgi:hypothetical protein
MKYLKHAANHWLNGKAIVLYEHPTRADAVIAVVETPSGKTLGRAERLSSLFESSLSLSRHAQMIEDISDGRVQYDWPAE